jgi:hypothetical protein
VSFIAFPQIPVLLQGLEAVLDKAVELEDGKKVSRFVKLVKLCLLYGILVAFPGAYQKLRRGSY